MGLHTSNFVIKEIKGRTVISNRQNVAFIINDAFRVGFIILKIKLIEKFKLKMTVLYQRRIILLGELREPHLLSVF